MYAGSNLSSCNPEYYKKNGQKYYKNRPKGLQTIDYNAGKIASKLMNKLALLFKMK